jgi:hypothetical protein
MSTNRLFAFVEGKDTDPFFYSALTRPICQAAGVPFDIVRSDIIAGSGGKQTLIALYLYLKLNHSLIQDVGKSPKWCLFFLDKDVDDVLRKLVNSPHIVYTPSYCVENLLFVHGELVLAAAAASSLEIDKIAAKIPDPDAWPRQKAEHWEEFLILSLLSHKLGVNCDCHYGRNSSPLNTPAEAPTNRGKADQIKAQLKADSGLPPAKFDQKFRSVSRYVACRYRKGLHDTLFNGKWYVEFLRREINSAAGGKRHNNPATGTLIATLNITLDFNAPWAEHFKKPLRDLINAPAP